MNRLFVFADLHGSLSGWLTIQALLSPDDGLAIAGDLFDTRYGSFGNPDFQPAEIRLALKSFDHPFFYVYGNCDVQGFFPGHHSSLTFTAFDRTIFLHHGHRPVPEGNRADIVLQGHTHLGELNEDEGQIVMNPGSIVLPRNRIPSYGLIDHTGVHLVKLATGRPLKSLGFT